MKHLKAAIVVFAVLFLGLMPEAKADLIDFYNHPFRPSVGARQKRLSINITLIPYVGSTNFMTYGDLGTLAKNFKMPEFDGDQLTKLQEMTQFVNKFYGMDSNMDAFTMPLFLVGFDTKYLEFKLAAGMKSFNNVAILGLREELDIMNVQKDEHDNYYLDLGKARDILRATSTNIFGGEAMVIGKVPIRKCKLLIGAGPYVGYRYDVSYSVMVSPALSEDDGIRELTEKNKHLVWGMNGMLGVEYNDGVFNPRFVVEGRQLYNSYISKYKPEFNMGFSMNVWKIGNFAADLMKIHDPTIKMEFSKSFFGNNEVAVGHIWRNTFGDRYMGYVALGLGGKFVKLDLMCIYSVNAVGGLMALRVGWDP